MNSINRSPFYTARESKDTIPDFFSEDEYFLKELTGPGRAGTNFKKLKNRHKITK